MQLDLCRTAVRRRGGRAKSPALVALKIEMLRAGLSRHDLARAAGLSPQTISCIICESGRNRGPLQRWRVERAMGAPFWSTPDEYARRVAIIGKIGFDPWLSPRKLLIRACRRAGVMKNCARSAILHISKEKLIALLAAHHQAGGSVVKTSDANFIRHGAGNSVQQHPPPQRGKAA